MGQCIYCNSSAGFLKRSHKECKEKHNSGKREIVSAVSSIQSHQGDVQQLEARIKGIAADSFIDQAALRNLVVSGWEKAVEFAFDDNVLTTQEESALTELKEHFSLSQDSLDRNGAFTKVIKGGVLRDILEGRLPERINVDRNLPFNLQKTEKIVWVFQNTDYYEEKMRTRYVGGHQGVSIRVARGLYYRTGGFRGERVQTSETVHADSGLLGVTNKHIYFAGSSKRFRIRYDKIVAFEPYSNGVGVQRDAVTAKPQSFATGDGWFTYNLITNLAQM